MLHQLAGDPLDLVALLVGQVGIGLGEQVEDGELGLGESLANRALLLLREVPRERLQTAQHLVDVQAARVVLVDQLAELLDEVEPGRVAPRARLELVAELSC